jgi:ribosomal protein L31
VALWDAVEETLTAWQDAGSPDIESVRLHITEQAHTYWIGDQQALRWEHRII